MNEVKQAFIVEFQKPKIEQQSYVEMKNIKQILGESAWEYDKRFRDFMSRLTYQIHDAQHKEWFIGGLRYFTRMPATNMGFTKRSSTTCDED
uniref:Retrotransposon gag domain-containing protein n=1 Tax=Picea glauca TaxID=3330 RepID=A0A101LUB8_PICGL|nr:hypothetical protein ABT39_MTgene3471 [Picea glauca]